jgi:hypothetical protein
MADENFRFRCNRILVWQQDPGLKAAPNASSAPLDGIN